MKRIKIIIRENNWSENRLFGELFIRSIIIIIIIIFITYFSELFKLPDQSIAIFNRVDFHEHTHWNDD